MIKSRPCKICQSVWHTAMFHKERKPLKRTALPRPTRRIKHESAKHRQQRELTTAEFIRLNPPNKNGLWECYLQVVPDCLRWVDKETLNPEHKLSKVRHPELRYDPKNIGPGCSPCNAFKGSRDWVDGKLV